MRGFGDLEAAVMQQIWDFAAPTTVRQVYTELIRDRTLAYTTVLSVMGKLCRKGFLQREREGKAHRYRAVATREQYGAALMREALSGSGNREKALLDFVRQMTPEEEEALRAALNSLERKPSDT